MKVKTLKKEIPQKDNSRGNKRLKIPFSKNIYADVLKVATILLLGIIIYSNSFNCSFHFDDLTSLLNNKTIQDFSNVKAWWHSTTRPVAMFTFMLNYHFSQFNVWSYHLVNLIIHLSNALLAGWLIMLIFSSPIIRNNNIVKHKKTIAFFTALLFVSHPLATQSITYIIQRQTSLAAMFYLLSLAFYVKGRLSDKANKFAYLLFAGSLIAAILAIFSKENAYTLPLAILLFEIFFLQTKKLSVNFKDYRIILLIAGFLGIIVLALFKFSFSIFNTIPPNNISTYSISPLNYFFTQFSVIIKYIQLLILPINQNLDYDFALSSGFFEIRTLLSFLLLIALIVLAIALYKKHRLFSFGIFWFFLTLSVESSIVPINDLIFEHRTYLPSVGFFLILSTGIALLSQKNKYLAIILFSTIILSNSILTYERNKVWKNDITLWSDVVLKSPRKARPHVNLGVNYANMKDPSKAITYFSKAIEINPGFLYAYWNRGLAYEDIHQRDKAFADYTKAIMIDPKCIDAYYNRGVMYDKLGQLDKSTADYSKIIEINPKYSKAYNNRGVAYEKLGQLDKSLADYTKGIELDFLIANAHFNRGSIYLRLGQWEKAIYDFNTAISLDPKYVKAYNNRGIAHGNLGYWDDAISDFSKAIETDPNFKDAYRNRDLAYQKMESQKKQQISPK